MGLWLYRRTHQLRVSRTRGFNHGRNWSKRWSAVHKAWTIPQPCRADGPLRDVDKYEILVLGSGKRGKYLAWTMAKEGRRHCSRRGKMVGGSCPNIACLPRGLPAGSHHPAD